MRLTPIGAPTDTSASVAGCHFGPGALRVTGIGRAPQAFGVDVRDAGDVTGPSNPQSPPVDGYHYLPKMIERNRAVRDAVVVELADGRMPVLMGDDHSLAIGSISAIAAYCRKAGKKLCVIRADAHADINTNELTPSGDIHGMPVVCLLGGGSEELTGMSDRKLAIGVDNIRQAGLRSVDPGEKWVLVDRGFEVFGMRSLDEAGIRHAMECALHDIDGGIHIHLSLNLDFVDPQIASGVGTLVVGGSTYREAQLTMEMIADTGRLGSIDLIGINPALDIRNTTAELAVDLVESLFGRSILLRFTEARRPIAPGRGRM